MIDTELLGEVQRLLIEPVDGGATWPSGLWTAAEVLGYLNQRQNRFLKESSVVTATGYVLYSTPAYVADLPSDWIATIRCVWRDDATHSYTPMYNGDTQGVDWGSPAWRGTLGTPQVWSDSEEASPPRLRVLPAPAADGRVELVYVACADPCDGTGVVLTVPDEYTVSLRYGVLADMLGKQGRAFDAARAGYAETRFVEGITQARQQLRAVGGG